MGLYCFGQNKTNLKEVVVRPDHAKVVLGTHKQKADYGHGGSRAYPNYQTAFLVPSSGVEGFIDRVGIYIYHKHTFLELFKKPNKLRIYLYAVNAKGLPGELLLPQPIVIQPEKNSYWHWVDVSGYHLTLPKEGIFAAVGWPQARKEDTGPYVGMTNECDNCPFYVYRFLTDEPTWFKVEPSQHKGRNEEEKYNQNLMVRLEVSVKQKP
ncbi:hypothetical protein CLV24_101262 [Pontibacter ummariensis]|uniref:Uncharacterized protein n=2 Tax=Pontibacter ummariensis TaxID=1610492 RepID=A0A239BC99_9BACT|nr:hypothetical protein CLV24_101262 [Pontibacter ummariensis]SNS04784.1 hypothetical protein SAMN06296052_101262 [Pontibacter ummariensis]